MWRAQKFPLADSFKAASWISASASSLRKVVFVHFQLLEPFGVIGFQLDVLIAPPVLPLLTNLELLANR